MRVDEVGGAMADVGIEIEVGAGTRLGEYAVRVVKSPGGAAPHGTLSLDVDAVLRRRDELERAVLRSTEVDRPSSSRVARQLSWRWGAFIRDVRRLRTPVPCALGPGEPNGGE